ncbi:MAG: bifunctional adenosylcobinamide kinase/adenosylcobinamide-phosphate guanylyltransferase [Veillonellaceae bacterium]|jgi:adenosylcobinamide kinase/adenosylcobinamide-phosphate guanylyltransferase|nr:bifunctional adenosylcobinamide kinase/adenosylcobinamide-phosphate guanylyltransferase [Veillonellaceae bacterium]
MSGKIILVTGGARSGKSTFAEQYASEQRKTVAYIATAQIYDTEMQERVTMHRERRPNNWLTYEAPYADADTIKAAAASADVILFDCLTLYTSNLLLSSEAHKHREERVSYILNRVEQLIEAARQSTATVIFVTNEVGLGIVPDNALAREYRDMAGWVNQKVAASAEEVYLVVSGLPVELKKLAVKLGEGGVRHG